MTAPFGSLVVLGRFPLATKPTARKVNALHTLDEKARHADVPDRGPLHRIHRKGRPVNANVARFAAVVAAIAGAVYFWRRSQRSGSPTEEF